MTTFDQADQAVASAAPVELYTFVAPVATWRLTSYEADVVFGGNTYTATAGSRSNAWTADANSDPTSVDVDLPEGHALVLQYVAGNPMGSLQVTITRYFPVFGVFAQIWQGNAASLSFRGEMATFRVPSATADALAAACPSVCMTRNCNHALYDTRCGVLRGSFTTSTTISSVSADGTTIALAATVPAPTNGIGWSVHGDVFHAGSQERRTIIAEATDRKTLTLFAPFPNNAIHVGDAVSVYAGCKRDIDTCDAKFTNAINFAGDPYLPPSNIFYVGLVAGVYRSG